MLCRFCSSRSLHETMLGCSNLDQTLSSNLHNQSITSISATQLDMQNHRGQHSSNCLSSFTSTHQHLSPFSFTTKYSQEKRNELREKDGGRKYVQEKKQKAGEEEELCNSILNHPSNHSSCCCKSSPESKHRKVRMNIYPFFIFFYETKI